MTRFFSRAAVVAWALAAVLAQAQQAYEPQRGQAGKDVIWIATPDAAVTRMLQMAEVKPQDRVVDLGSGDGKITLAAAREFGATARGLEYNPKLVAHARSLAEQAGLVDRVTFEQADIFTSDFSEASVVTLYLLPHLNLKLRPSLLAMRPGTRVVSHSFSMGEWAPDETARVGTADLLLWHVPANVSGDWRLQVGDRELTLEVLQSFQRLRGEARAGQLKAGLVAPEIRGDRLRFGLRDAQGVLQQFSGQVVGERIEGEVVTPGQPARVRFVAERIGGRADVARAMPPRPEVVLD